MEYGRKQVRQKVKKNETKDINRLRNDCIWQIRSKYDSNIPELTR